MSVTVLTDASACHETLVAGWAAVVTESRDGFARRRLFGGPLRGTGWDDINAAELCAAANGLWAALRHGFAPPGSRVTLVLDSEAAIGLIGRLSCGRLRDSRIPPSWREPARYIHDVVHHRGVALETRKVKAHSLAWVADPEDGSWAALNQRVDMEARRHMSAARAELREPVARRAEAPPLVLEADPDSPLEMLGAAWERGLVEARHVRWALERAVDEERARFPREHAAVALALAERHTPRLREESDASLVLRGTTAAEMVSEAWPLLCGSRLLRRAGRRGGLLLARPEANTSVRRDLERRASLLGHSGLHIAPRQPVPA